MFNFLPISGSCRRARALMWDYVSANLSEGPLEQVEAHLDGCGACRREAASCKRSQALLSAARENGVPVPRTDWSEMRARIAAEAARPVAVVAEPVRRGMPTLRLAGAGALGVALAVGVFALNSRRPARSHAAPPGPYVAQSSPHTPAPTMEPVSLGITPSDLLLPASGAAATTAAVQKGSAGAVQADRRQAPQSTGHIKFHPFREHSMPPAPDASQVQKRRYIEPVADGSADTHRYVIGALTPVSRDDDTVY